MATWQEIEKEIKGSNGNVDSVRRKKLKNLFNITKRPVLLYGVEMFDPGKINAIQGNIVIDLTDKDGFLQALIGITGNEIDVILHSPGGSPEATESLVDLLRRRFNSIRFIIPNIAKSAATMMAMSGDEIILGMDAELGPTDPQMIINSRVHPAHAILKQFDEAKKEVAKNSENLPAWLPILQQYGPSLLMECKNGIKLSKTLVTEWLSKYMLNGKTKAKYKASLISSFLASPKHLSHGRSINISKLKQMGVNIKYTNELNPEISEAVQDIYLSLIMTFMSSGAFKIYENHLGNGFYRSIQVTVIPNPASVSAPQVIPPRGSN